jgi:hypothetical protein
MKTVTVFLSGATWLLLLAFANHAQAQISPVRLSVSKHQKINQNTISQNDRLDTGVREQEVNEEVYYTIVVANAGAASVPNAKIKWAILVKPIRSTKLELVEGERTCSLSFGQKFAFDTDLVQLSGRKWQSRDGWYRRTVSAQIVGYAVEVYMGDKIVASAVDPSDVRRKIELLRGGEGKQQLHQF